MLNVRIPLNGAISKKFSKKAEDIILKCQFHWKRETRSFYTGDVVKISFIKKFNKIHFPIYFLIPKSFINYKGGITTFQVGQFCSLKPKLDIFEGDYGIKT